MMYKPIKPTIVAVSMLALSACATGPDESAQGL